MECKGLQNKIQILEELKEFLRKCGDITDNVCETLSWDKNEILNEGNELGRCLVNPGHRVPINKLSQHTENCKLRMKGFSNQDISHMVPSSQYFYENATNVYSVVIDKEKQNEVLRNCTTGVFVEKDVPVCGDQAFLTLTPQERLSLHQSVIAAAKDAGKPVTEISDELLLTDLTKKNYNDDDGVPKSKGEMKAAERDMKRRRQTYRAKNVHITKKSYTEVIREVIENQTELLKRTNKASDKDTEQGDDETLSREVRSRSPRRGQKSESPNISRPPRKRSQSPNKSPRSYKDRSPSPRNRSRSPIERSQNRRRSHSTERSEKRSRSKKKRHRRSRSRSSSRSHHSSSRRSPSVESYSQSRREKHKSKHKKHKTERS